MYSFLYILIICNTLPTISLKINKFFNIFTVLIYQYRHIFQKIIVTVLLKVYLLKGHFKIFKFIKRSLYIMQQCFEKQAETKVH